MRAVIFSTGDWAGIAPMNERYPAPLVHLVDRPFLQHVVEHLVHQGVKRFDLVLSYLPEKIEQFLGDGKRWGCSITYHLARRAERPYRQLRTMTFHRADEQIVLGHADRLPQLQLAELRDQAGCLQPAFFQCDSPALPEWSGWTGWAIRAAGRLAEVPADADEAGLERYLTGLPGALACRVLVPQLLRFQTFADILAAHKLVLANQFAGLRLTGKEADPGIWLSRNVVLHPTAQLLAPVYIDENCAIGAGVKLGPNAVVGAGCVLDSHSTVSDSVIFSGSYVGEHLELADVIVDKNRLVNARHGSVVTVTDNFILGNLAEKHLRRWLVHQAARLVALLLFVAALPVLVLVALFLKLLRKGPVLYRKEVVCLPAQPEDLAWRTFSLWSFCADPAPEQGPVVPSASWRGLLLRFLPGLLNVVDGELSFVGVPPRSSAEAKKLPRDWQSLYLAGKAGIVTEASVTCGPDPTEDELFAAETVYVASAGFRHDFKLLAKYLARSLFRVGARVYVEEVETVPEEVPVG